MNYIKMTTNYNSYNNTYTRKKFYVYNRGILNKYKHEFVNTEYNKKYSDDYDFYRIKSDSTPCYIAVLKPSYRLTFDDGYIWEYDYNEIVDTVDGNCGVSDIHIGDKVYCFDDILRILIKIDEF